MSASFSDPYVLVIKDDTTMIVLKVESTGDIEEVELEGSLATNNYISGCLYEDSNDVFRLEADETEDYEAGNILMFLLTVGGGLKACFFPDMGLLLY